MHRVDMVSLDLPNDRLAALVKAGTGGIMFTVEIPAVAKFAFLGFNEQDQRAMIGYYVEPDSGMAPRSWFVVPVLNGWSTEEGFVFEPKCTLVHSTFGMFVVYEATLVEASDASN